MELTELLPHVARGLNINWDEATRYAGLNAESRVRLAQSSASVTARPTPIQWSGSAGRGTRQRRYERRLRYRVNRTAVSFRAFVYLAILVLCVRRLVGDARRHQERRMRRC
jgi:hypothetical protein